MKGSLMTSKRSLIGILLGLMVLFGAVGVIVFRNNFYSFFKAASPSPQENNVVFMKVGKEELYQKDLDYEISQSPQGGSANGKQIIVNKMVSDSVVLQAAADDHIVALDPSIFNSSQKDYQKRIEKIMSIKEFITNSNDIMEGSVVSIWYHNNLWVGPLGLAKGKALAYEKIKKLHDDVAAGKMTIAQAGEAIKKDESIAQLDRSYKSNAIFSFKSLRSEAKPITLSRELDSDLWNLPAGGVTDIYLGKAIDLKDTSKTYDALYSFGFVARRTAKGSQNVSFDQWLASKVNKYPVVQ